MDAGASILKSTKELKEARFYAKINLFFVFRNPKVMKIMSTILQNNLPTRCSYVLAINQYPLGITVEGR